MSELERSLRALAAEIDYPPTPDLSAPTGAHRPRPRPTRALVFAAVALLALAGGAAAALISRDDPKGVDIRVVDRLPVLPAEEPQPPPLGERVSLARARELASFRVLSPPERPSRVHYSDRVLNGAVTLVYPQARITEFGGSIERDLVRKLVTPETRVERFRLGGEPATWITGPGHAVLLLDSAGNVIEETLRRAGNVLLAQRGEVLVRVEGELSRAEAVALVCSLR